VVVDEATGMSHPVMIIEGRCRALDPERRTCTIYRKRAYSCATFPFSLTPEGELRISRYCEGFGKGPVVDEGEMVKHILKWRRRAGMSREHLRRGKGRR
jgi:Fe-S-cluster containining protein